MSGENEEIKQTTTHLNPISESKLCEKLKKKMKKLLEQSWKIRRCNVLQLKIMTILNVYNLLTQNMFRLYNAPWR